VTDKVYIRHYQRYNINDLFSLNTLHFTFEKRSEKCSHKRIVLTNAERSGTDK